ncbi:VWA domain-containing protein [Dongia deserti]|uniref:VWA domain-containing protein n=1 Tax=Dongia deserti TaxID=2268030 RepID=UPI000E64FC30|nr:VWA domain-containing protein [Dongia deserti]
MTVDETSQTRDAYASNSDVTITKTDLDVATVQLTAANAVRVELPQGQRIVVVPVTPGETIELPTDSEQGLLAELGREGNLGIIVDGRTIILQGYAAANEESPITIITSDGEPIDIADVIAETDPSLDIQTAAGPAAGGQGAGANGSGIFVPFPVDAALGGLSSAGILDPTALSYKLITDETKIFSLGDDEPGEPGIENSFPEANPDSVTVTQAVATDYQLMLVIDVSASMGQEVVRSDGTVTTRMELQKAAAVAMLESYATAAAGSVNVKLVQFSSGASYFGGTSATTFIDITNPANLAAVTAAINALSPANLTDYDTALATAQQGIMDPSWVATTATTKGLVYFFSDGRPVDDGDAASSYPGGSKANSLNQTEENLWEGRTSAGAFTSGLADKGVVSIAVGLGADVPVPQLERAAYYNETFPDQPVIVVQDENQLGVELAQTVPGTVTGNVLTNDDSGADGFGTPTIIAVSAVIDGDTTSQIVTDTATGYTIETNNGVLVVDKTTGDFTYTATPGSSGKTDTFTYTVQDASPGDTASSILTVAITGPTIVSGSAPFEGSANADFIIGDDADNVIVAAAGIDAVQGGFGNDKLDGGTGNDALFGQEGNDALFGGDDDDALFGGTFGDTLNGGAGFDALRGGSGNDRLDGGDDGDADILSGDVGEDVLVWRGADDTYDGGADLFKAATGAAGDVLDASGATTIDLTALDDSKITDVETIRMNGGGGTSLTLDANDVISDLEGGSFDPGGSGSGGAFGKAPAVRVDGDAGDTLNLSGGAWSETKGSSGTPAGYTLYVHDAGGGAPGTNEDAYVLVQNGVSVTGA